MELLNFQTAQEKSRLRMRLLTWNQARTSQQKVTLNEPHTLLPNPADSDIIAVTFQESEKNNKSYRIGELTSYLEKHGFVNIDTYCGMWEMIIAVYCKKELRREISCVVKAYKAKGKFGMVGNKGAVSYSFLLRQRVFNFIGCHLKHGAENCDKRNKMIAELLRELKLQPTQYKNLDLDSTGDLNVIFGDLNYRIESTFAHLSKNIQESITKPELEQLS